MIRYRPLRIKRNDKQELRTQFGALCYRIANDRVEILLITGRRSGHWILPKGWPIDKATPAESALREAYEEAGVKGKVTGNCIGIFTHFSHERHSGLPRIVAVFPVRVKALLEDYPERKERKRRWLSRRKAAKKVKSPELAQIIRDFTPPDLPARHK